MRVSWQDNSTDEKGFDIWVRDAADATNRWIAGSVEADQTRYTISQGLEDGAGYFFGVQGKGTSEAGDSRVVYEFFTLTPSSELPVVEIDGQAAKSYASQGQTRTAALSLKLAAREIFQQDTGEYPVLLLDDVLSELDPRRQEFVLNRIRGGQVFITCCEDDRLPQLLGGRIFHVKNGTVR